MPVKNVLASTARSWETRADDAAPAAEPPRGERAPVGGAGLRAAAGLPRCAVPRPSTRFRNESKSGLASPSFFLPDVIIWQNLFKLIQFIPGIVGKGRCIDFSTVHF